MKHFHIRYSDGTTTVIKATNEDMARQFAMEQKYGAPSANRTWSCNTWYGRGLIAKEVANANVVG